MSRYNSTLYMKYEMYKIILHKYVNTILSIVQSSYFGIKLILHKMHIGCLKFKSFIKTLGACRGLIKLREKVLLGVARFHSTLEKLMKKETKRF